MFDRVFQLQTHTHKDKHKDVQTQRLKQRLSQKQAHT